MGIWRLKKGLTGGVVVSETERWEEVEMGRERCWAR
jgi:hypothetical protein